MEHANAYTLALRQDYPKKSAAGKRGYIEINRRLPLSVRMSLCNLEIWRLEPYAFKAPVSSGTA